MTGLTQMGLVVASCLMLAACAVGGDAESLTGDATGGDGGTITITTEIDAKVNGPGTDISNAGSNNN